MQKALQMNKKGDVNFMRKIVKKVLCFALCFAMCLSVTAYAEINRTVLRTAVSMSGERKGITLGDSNGHSPTGLTPGTGYLTQYINIDPDSGYVLDAVRACVHGDSADNSKSITFRVYKWNKDNATTLASEPLAETVITSFTDNGYYEIYMEEDYSGELLFWAGNVVVGAGIWNSPAKTNDYSAKLYVNGVEKEGRLLESTMYLRKPEVIPDEDGTRDAYALHEATDFSVNKLNVTERELDNGTKAEVLDVDDGGRWVCYKNVDFGKTSPKSLKMQILNRACKDLTVEMQLVADDAKKGDILGSAMTYYSKADTFVEDINLRLTKEITGVHDIYITFNRGGISLINWQFTKEALPYTSLDKLYDDFKPVSDSTIIDDYSDTWVGTDMVGRKLPSIDEAGKVKDEEKYVVMFYWVWNAMDSMKTLKDNRLNVQNVLDLYEGDIQDILYDNTWKGWKGAGAVYWNESIYGYYFGLDEWAKRKELELLTAADVDLLVIDCASSIYSGGYLSTCKIMHEMRKDGLNPPKLTLRIDWSAHGSGMEQLEQYYNEFIDPGLYSDTWFMYEGKPLICAYEGCCDIKANDAERDAYRKEIKENVTFRGLQSSYFAGQTTEHQWPWLEVYPQHIFGTTETGGPECVGVGIAQNTAPGFTTYTAFNQPNCFGRSYTYKDKFSKLSDDSDYYGYNFQEQWDRALEIDPRFVFVTGWNELSTARMATYNVSVKEAIITNGFGDTFCDEYSRDIIPIKGDFKDTYYMQLMSNIRKFKGVRATPVANEARTVSLGDFDAWESVEPEFTAYRGGTEPRNEYATGARMRYRNYTGRNDILSSKVTRDDQNVYFYVETADNLSPYTDDAWMRLFLNTDREYYTGWEGYDYVINRVSPTSSKVVVERNIGSDNAWKWEKVGEGDYVVSGNKMMLSIDRSLLGLEGKALDFEFKWNDNMQQDGYLMDFYVNGDTAPVGRLNYHYIESAAQDTTPDDEFIVPYKQLHDAVKYDVALFVGNPKGFVSGDVELIDAQNRDVVPLIINDKTMVPIRFISEALDAKVEWDDATSTATITRMLTKVFITEGKNELKVSKRSYPLQSPAVTINDRLYVPLRDITEALGLECFWDDSGLIIIGETAYRTATNGTIQGLIDFYTSIDLKK